MLQSDRCQRLLFSQIAHLKKTDLILPDFATLAQLNDFIRRLSSLCERSVWLTVRHDLKDTVYTSLFALQPLDAASGRFYLHLFPSRTSFNAGSILSIENKAFGDLNVFRLETTVGLADLSLKSELTRQGWQKEGQMQSACYDQAKGRHLDLNLFSLIRPQHSPPGVALAPFKAAVIAVYGDSNGISRSLFARYGERSQDFLLQEQLALFSLIDDGGRLYERDLIIALAGDRGYFARDNAPQVVHLAARQLQEYFAGQRTEFTVPLQLNEGSLFQKKVWRTLETILYGETAAYLDIAQRLDDQDPAAARKKARAVGSACSANPLPVLLPCHRVIGRDGKLVGFSDGLDLKEYLLALEIMGLD